MVLHGIVLLALARGLYLARHLPTLFNWRWVGVQLNTILSPFSCHSSRTFEHSFGAHSKKWTNMAIPSLSLCMTQIWPKVVDCDDREVLHPKFVRGDRFISASSFYPIFGKREISILFSKNARKYWLCNCFYSASNHVPVQQTLILASQDHT